MRLVSQDGLIDIPYDQAVLVVEKEELLPFGDPYEENECEVVIEAIASRKYAIMAKVDDTATARKVLEHIRRHYYGGEKVVYLADIIEEVT